MKTERVIRERERDTERVRKLTRARGHMSNILHVTVGSSKDPVVSIHTYLFTTLLLPLVLYFIL